MTRLSTSLRICSSDAVIHRLHGIAAGGLAKLGEETKIGLVPAICASEKLLSSKKLRDESAVCKHKAECCQCLVEVVSQLLPLVVLLAVTALHELRRQHLPVLLLGRALLVTDLKNDHSSSCSRQALVFRAELVIQALQVTDVKASLRSGFQILVGADGGVEFLQDASVVHQHAVPLGVMQAVDDARHGLNQVVPFRGLSMYSTVLRGSSKPVSSLSTTISKSGAPSVPKSLTTCFS